MKRRPLSCFVIVCNEADRIDDCLRGLAGWVDQLIVLDSGSTDNTAELARKYTDEVYITDWPGFGPQRNRALKKCKHDWVLNIDADERVTDELRREIDHLLSADTLHANLVEIPWRTYLFGKPLRFGRYSAPQGKLFLKAGAEFKDAQVHESLIIAEPKTVVLKSALDHHSWRSYEHVQQKHLQYATLLASQKFAAGKRGYLSYAVLRSFTDFLQQYVFRLGFLDGVRGLMMAIILGQYAFHKYAALAALHMEAKSSKR